MQTECAVCWGAECPLAGEAEVVWMLWQVPSQVHSQVNVQTLQVVHFHQQWILIKAVIYTIRAVARLRLWHCLSFNSFFSSLFTFLHEMIFFQFSDNDNQMLGVEPAIYMNRKAPSK